MTTNGGNDENRRQTTRKLRKQKNDGDVSKNFGHRQTTSKFSQYQLIRWIITSSIIKSTKQQHGWQKQRWSPPNYTNTNVSNKQK